MHIFLSRDPQNLVLRLFVSQHALDKPNSDDNNIALLLGLWFGIFPCPFDQLSRAVKAHKVRKEDIKNAAASEKPWWKHGDNSFDAAKESVKAWSEWKHNHLVDPPNHSLNPSIPGLGGSCPKGNSLATILKNYFSECLPDAFSQDSAPRRLIQRVAGLQSGYRMPMSSVNQSSDSKDTTDDEYLLGSKDALMLHLRYSGSKIIRNKVQSLTALLAHAENLGHTPAPFVEGLTVELLPFQLQTLQWAIERETIPGGVQSLHWAKVPLPQNANTDLYFNPLLGTFSRNKPNHVRGGWICESMGYVVS
jgi:hypothetical protein